MALFWLVTALAAIAAALFLPETAGLPLTLPALVLAGVAVVLWVRAVVRARRAGRDLVLIDGSNVMHWNNGTPDITVVRQVATALEAQGRRVVVMFDANAGYKLTNRYMNAAALARAMGLNARNVVVSPKGKPADGLLLQIARDQDAPIITNDRFRDWHEAFPHCTQPGRLIHGGYRNGAPYLRTARANPGKRTPA